MFFSRRDEGSKVLEAACKAGGLTLDRGRIIGSPERINLFTLSGDLLRCVAVLEAARCPQPSLAWLCSGWRRKRRVSEPRGGWPPHLLASMRSTRARCAPASRLDLDLDAHLGSTLQPSSTLLIEKGNRVDDGRLEMVRELARRDADACVLM